MDLATIIKQISERKKNYDQLLKSLKELSRLDNDPTKNLYKIQTRLSQISKYSDAPSINTDDRKIINEWTKEYKSELTIIEEKVKTQFGMKLDAALKKINLSLSGQYTNLKTSFFTIELDFNKGIANIWYGSKQESLVKCPLSVSEITKHITKIKNTLGSGLDNEQFIMKLREAYRRCLRGKTDEPVPIIDVLGEISFLLQDKQFIRNPKRENYKGYSRADFSYDLYKLKKNILSQSLFRNLHLIVATRAYTRQRKDFLWVPDDEDVIGTTYSHIQFKEGKR